MRVTEFKLRDIVEITREGLDKGKKAMYAYEISRGVHAVRFFNGREAVFTACELRKVE